MSTIGNFKKAGTDYAGTIVTFSLPAKNVRIAAESGNGNDAAPSHRVFVRKVEIGAAWSRSRRSRRE